MGDPWASLEMTIWIWMGFIHSCQNCLWFYCCQVCSPHSGTVSQHTRVGKEARHVVMPKRISIDQKVIREISYLSVFATNAIIINKIIDQERWQLFAAILPQKHPSMDSFVNIPTSSMPLNPSNSISSLWSGFREAHAQKITLSKIRWWQTTNW